jgi:hypothetical protein
MLGFHVEAPEHCLEGCVKLAGAAQFIKCFITNELGKILPANAPKAQFNTVHS